jgi:hypothetical protein
MKKFIAVFTLLFIATLCCPLVALASYNYYIPVTVYNNNSGSLTGVPILVTLNNSQLASMGYIQSSGLDTDMLEGSTSRDYMVADSKTGIFIPSISGYQSRTYDYRLGQSPTQEDLPFTAGYGGYVNITDAADLELGNNFSVEFDGWVDTSASNNLVNKTSAFRIWSPTSSSIRAAVITVLNTTLRPNGVGDETNIANVTGASTHWGAVSDSNDTSYVSTKSTSYQRDLYQLADVASNLYPCPIISVTVYFRITNTGGTTNAKPAFKIGGVVYNGTEQTYSGASFVNKTQTYTTSPASGAEWSWSEIDSMQVGISLNITYLAPLDEAKCADVWIVVSYYKGVTVTGISSGEQIVRVSANVTNMTLSVTDYNGNHQGDSPQLVTLDGMSVTNNSNPWILSIPSFDYYKQSVNGTQKAWYQPATMVLGTTLVDRTGLGHTGAITWGSNPSGIEITMGGMEPYSSFIPPGAEEGEIPEVLPTPGSVDMAPASGATGQGLPLYVNFQNAAISLGWTVPNTYAIMFMIVAIVVGVGAMAATGTIWGWVVGFGGTAALFGQVTDVGGYHIMPIWLTLVCVLFAIFCGYVWRYT